MSTSGTSDISKIRLAKKGEFVTRSIAGETILVPVRSQVGDLDSIYNLNDVAAFVWALLDGHTDVTQIVAAVCQEFDVTPADAEKDTLHFIGSLQAAGMIEPLAPKG